ncbi:MAG TPA: amylo-alpha-1,6-glucosidase, partial [Chryseolinea sp.]|nr:amylo-alpha-1,6-glucosidase [Chryseolinea sp.]
MTTGKGMTYGGDILHDFAISSGLEWLETNGLGGYASGTVSGALTRRYHGLLIAALEPPVKRTVLLSKLDETIVIDDGKYGTLQRYELGANQYPGAVHPMGYRYLERFEHDSFPVFYYAAGHVRLKKTIASLHEENTTLVLYEVETAPEAFILELLPLASARDHHGICRANPALGRQYLFEEGVFRTVNYHGGAELFVNVPGSEFLELQGWYYNLEYLRELERGLESQEDLYAHGSFAIKLRKSDRLGVIVSTEDPTGRDAFELFALEEKRRQKLQRKLSTTNPALPRLMLAADQFIVRRGKLHTVIAGYPWFSDWGRDTMISLPGLCLATGRLAIAREILLQFAQFVSEGMLPNRFPDHGERPEYNTFDATLWFFHAIYQYYLASKDIDLVQELLPVLSDIVDWHVRGTRYGIVVDASDQLLQGGQPGVQLTWMDAKVGDWVVTPRIGKPVEINALWYNALRIMEKLCQSVAKDELATEFAHRANVVHEAFQKAFWNARDNCLYDYLDD